MVLPARLLGFVSLFFTIALISSNFSVISPLCFGVRVWLVISNFIFILNNI